MRSCDLDFAALDKTPLAEVLTPGVQRKLGPLIQTDVSRHLWVFDREGSNIEVTADEGELRSGSHTTLISEIELELRAGEASSLFDLAEQIDEFTPLRLGVLS